MCAHTTNIILIVNPMLDVRVSCHIEDAEVMPYVAQRDVIKFAPNRCHLNVC